MNKRFFLPRPPRLALLASCLCLLATSVAAAFTEEELRIRSNVTPQISKDLGALFALDAVIHDRETVTLGFVNFDPNRFLPIDDDELGDEDAKRVKDELKTLTLPYTIQLGSPREGWHNYVTGRLGYTNRKNEVSLISELDPVRDINNQTIYSGHLAYGTYKQISRRWIFEAYLGGTLQRYKNDYEYRNALSKLLQPALDGLLTNYSVSAWQINPAIAFDYRRYWSRHQLRFRSRVSGQYGRSFGYHEPAHKTDIKAGSWRNTIYYKHPLGHLFANAVSFQAIVSRVDLTGDNRDAFDTPNYYEFGGNFLFNTARYGRGLVNNLSLGLLVNYGSALKGASIVFTYNNF